MFTRATLLGYAPVLLLAAVGCAANDEPSLLIYCAAIAREPMEKIAADYQTQRGVRIDLQFGGTNTLLGKAELSQTGDLLLPADAAYLRRPGRGDLVVESTPIASSQPVLVVNAAAEKQITRLEELLSDHVRIALANPDTAAIGATAVKLFEKRGLWPAVKQAVEARGVFTPTVTGVANAIELGGADAGIVWDVIANRRPGLRVIKVAGMPAEDNRSLLKLALLKSSTNVTAARAFVGYVAGVGAKVFADCGFGPPEGAP